MSVKNLANEAERMLANLSLRDKYNLFEIVLQQLGKRQSPDKQAELNAVYRAIVQDRETDKTTLKQKERGYQNSISNDIRGGDLTGNARKNRKKA